MQTSKEYLLFSILSYYNLDNSSKGQYIVNSFKGIDFGRNTTNANLFRDDIYGRCIEYFKEELKSWKVYDIDNRTGVAEKGKSKSGFFAIVFNKNDEYVISYRGSETYPFEEAYRDFIETDLRIGMGKKPLQFWEGLEVFENLLSRGIPFEKISVTGHSLGGGIAQFVAVMLYKKYKKIPRVCTWNAVGINRDGIIGIEDFIEYEKILDSCNLTDEEKEIFKEFKEPYLDFLLKELKKYKVIKDNRTVLLDKYSTFYFQIDDVFIEQLSKQTNFKSILNKFSLERRKELLLKEEIIDKLFQIDNLTEILNDAVSFIKTLNENKVFENNVINFCHSKDLVSFLFPHIGTTYQVDLNFMKKDATKSSFFRNFSIFKKSVQSYHFEDVFIPFLDSSGAFTDIISIDYASSVLRKVLYLERTFKKEFLGFYFMKTEITIDNYKTFKSNLMTGIEKIGEDILYKEKIKAKIQLMEYEDIEKLWKKTIDKVASPYISQDIYDLIVFRKNYI
ncbi:hypothetical protein [Fusobacterium sp.]|uniref:lipase family protein n=1 Tax=Fusobacterium sp. TaxID=68766 RepID=UPI0026132E92|nr:hypothetical protein [Fusobacterium sp.]